MLGSIHPPTRGHYMNRPPYEPPNCCTGNTPEQRNNPDNRGLTPDEMIVAIGARYPLREVYLFRNNVSF